MKKGKILVVGLIALLMAGGLVWAGCYLPPDNNNSGNSNNSGNTSGNTSGCRGNGNCRVMTNQSAAGAYEYCGDYGCAVGNVPYPVPPNTNVSCDCK